MRHRKRAATSSPAPGTEQGAAPEPEAESDAAGPASGSPQEYQPVPLGKCPTCGVFNTWIPTCATCGHRFTTHRIDLNRTKCERATVKDGQVTEVCRCQSFVYRRPPAPWPDQQIDPSEAGGDAA